MSLELRDDWKAPGGRMMGMNNAFAKALRETQDQLDAALARLAPGLVATGSRNDATAANLGPVDGANLASSEPADIVAARSTGPWAEARRETAPQACGKGVAASSSRVLTAPRRWR